ncbi:P-type conjugative transfer protein TrbJ [Pandoraea apista]|uniref:P-type conjugative transfer protein TrbJ n=1 Tax=Pandoraea apista TaxID=93218 RepID=UPI00065A7183|nr:P-type conjugative transfer protein TrbJ [Pandoraea apista]ALS68411.1 P-type conjugative transfer protein TrbJ [Pandoraea apista]CFB60435.1 hypothetical protein LMG16407_00474 [Pandoraea apista]
MNLRNLISHLAAKVGCATAIALSVLAAPAHAGIPVIDGTNVVQTTVSALNSVASVAKQIEQYQTQLQQYENMLRNSLAPAAYIWDQVNSTINKMLNLQDTLSGLKGQYGSIDAYLNRFQNVGYYRQSPCFTNTGCSASEMEAIQQGRTAWSDSQKKANDAAIKQLDQQQSALSKDADTVARLQSQASGAGGQMEALQAANQLASTQANSLLNIRSLLLAQQNILVTRSQIEADREAQLQAGDEQFRRGAFTKSPAVSW